MISLCIRLGCRIIIPLTGVADTSLITAVIRANNRFIGYLSGRATHIILVIFTGSPVVFLAFFKIFTVIGTSLRRIRRQCTGSHSITVIFTPIGRPITFIDIFISVGAPFSRIRSRGTAGSFYLISQRSTALRNTEILIAEIRPYSSVSNKADSCLPLKSL